MRCLPPMAINLYVVLKQHVQALFSGGPRFCYTLPLGEVGAHRHYSEPPSRLEHVILDDPDHSLSVDLRHEITRYSPAVTVDHDCDTSAMSGNPRP